MTLATVPRYGPARIAESGGRAVVVGASMAGLLAARVLTDRFETVTIVEKDSLPADPVARKGVPQARHVHTMHEAGRTTLEDLFPGFSEELIGAGALLLDLSTDFKFYDEGDFLADGPTHLPFYCASRPLFEQITRRRVAHLDGVTIREQCQFVDYLVDDASTVGGVTVREGDAEEDLTAELVVDATGRSSRTPSWLENHGYPSPSTDEVHIDLAYSTALLERPTDDRRALLSMFDPPRTRAAAVFPIENERWMMTLAGIHGDHPPTDPEGFADYAASLPVPEFEQLVDEHELVSGDIHHYPFPTTVRHHYEELDRFPDGLVVLGDAIASFNPIYGQGMSVAALEAVQLHHTLAAGGRDDLGARFFERSARVVDDAWNLAVGSDFQFSRTSGPKPRGTDLLNRYLSRLTRKAHANGRLAEAFWRVIMMEKPPTSLFRPGVLWRVLKPAR